MSQRPYGSFDVGASTYLTLESRAHIDYDTAIGGGLGWRIFLDSREERLPSALEGGRRIAGGLTQGKGN